MIGVLALLESATVMPVIPTDAERMEIVLNEVAGEEVTVRTSVPFPPPQLLTQPLIPLHPERE